MKSIITRLLSLALGFSGIIMASQIGLGGFTSPTVDTFDGLGLPAIGSAPLTRPYGSYTTDNGTIRYFAFGPGICIANECIGSNTDKGYLDLVFTVPVLRAGGFVARSSATITFYDETNQMIGSINAPGPAPAFVGWQADSGLISRIHIQDTETNLAITTLDNLTYEFGESSIPQSDTPEPATTAMIGGGLMLVALARRKATRTANRL
jgi:hypothetical protein